MTYKINLKENMDKKYNDLMEKGYDNVIYSKLKLRSSFYSSQDEKFIREMLSKGIPQTEIAKVINKTLHYCC